METAKFVGAFISTFFSTLWLFWLIFVYPYSNVSMKSAWVGTAGGFIAGVLFVGLFAYWLGSE